MIKKRKRLITLISSILTCTALCGLFALSSFTSEKQKVESVSAVDLNLYSSNGVYNYTIPYDYVIHPVYDGVTYTTSQTGTMTIGINYKYDYIKYYVEDIANYRFNLTFTISVTFVNVTTTDLEGDNMPPLYNDTYNYFGVLKIGQVTTLREYSYSSESSINNTYNANFVFKLVRSGYDNLPSVSLNGSEFLYTYTSFNDPVSLNLRTMNYTNPFISSANIISQFLVDVELNFVNESFTYTSNSYDEGQQVGYQAGYNDGFSSGSNSGYNDGYTQGYNDGVAYQESVNENINATSYASGYSAGYQQGQSQSSTVTSIFNGITTVALVPVKFFLNIFNFEILGVNIASVVSALMSICLILIVWRAVMGGKSND